MELPKPGDLIAERYRLKSVLGQGGMGIVFLAQEETHVKGREDAVKFLSYTSSLPSQDAKRFRDEMEILSKLEHSNVVPIYDFDIVENTAYMVLRYIKGGSLAERISNPKKPSWPNYDQRDQLILDLFSAMDAVHKRGVAHLDLKPSNILIDTDTSDAWGPALVSDFGIAVFTKKTRQNQPNFNIGTPGFSAPELTRGKVLKPHLADIYSLGIILLLLYTHQYHPIDLNNASNKLPDELKNVIFTATAENPEERYPSIDAFRKAWEAAPAPPIRAPYKGMQPFRDDESEIFFGREKKITEYIERLSSFNFLAISGPSGVGKSSLVYAGIIPKIMASPDEWENINIFPGNYPLYALAERICRSTGTDTEKIAQRMMKDPTLFAGFLLDYLEMKGCKKLLLFIDQFEQLITLSDIAQTKPFLDNLLFALESKPSQLTIIITLRTDFLGKFSSVKFEALRSLIQDHHCILGEMNEDELHSVILGPSRHKYWQLKYDEGLVDLIVKDVNQAPIPLPFLSQALLETWKLRRNRQMTVYGYQNTGGVSKAISHAADIVYEKLPPMHQIVARRILLRCIQFGTDDTPNTHRRQSVVSLMAINEDSKIFYQTLQSLIDGRLLVPYGDEQNLNSVDLVHDTLFTAWPKLQSWIKEYREDGLRFDSLATAADRWIHSGKRKEDLIGELRLGDALQWVQSQDTEELGIRINPTIEEFLHASQNNVDEVRRREKRIQTFRLTALVVVSLLLIVAMAAAFFAFASQRKAQQSANNLATQVVIRSTAQAVAVENEAEAVKQAELARLNQITTQAKANLVQKPQLGVLLSLYSYLQSEKGPDTWFPEAIQTLEDSLQTVNGAGFQAYPCAFQGILSPDSHWFVTCGSENSIALLKIGSLDEFPYPILLKGHSNYVRDVVFVQPKNALISVGDDHTIRTWFLEDKKKEIIPIRTFSTNEVIHHIYINEKSDRLLLISEDGEISRWDITDFENIFQIDSIVLDLPIETYNLSPNGKWLIVGTTKELYFGDIYLYSLGEDFAIKKSFLLKGHKNRKLNASAFDPSGKWLITGNRGDSIIAWDLTSDDPSAEYSELKTGFTNWELERFLIEFSPDGQWLAISCSVHNLNFYGADFEVQQPRLWKITGSNIAAEPTVLEGHTDELTSISFSQDSSWFASGSMDGVVRIWNLEAEDIPSTYKHFKANQNAVTDLTYSPNNRWLAIGGGHSLYDNGDNTIALFDMENINSTFDIQHIVGHEFRINQVHISYDSQYIISMDSNYHVRLNKINRINSNAALPQIETVFEDQIEFIELTPDSKWLLILTSKGDLFVWDYMEFDLANKPQKISGRINNVGFVEINTVAISDDGRWVAAGHMDGSISLWDLTSEDSWNHPQRLHYRDSIPISLDFSLDGQKLAVTKTASTIEIWRTDDTNLNQPERLIEADNAPLIARFDPLGRWLAVAGGDISKIRQRCDIYLYDLSNPSIEPIVIEGHDNTIFHIAFSPDGKWMASSSGTYLGYIEGVNYAVGIFNLETQDGWIDDVHQSVIADLEFSPDSRWLASASSDYTINLWDFKNKTPEKDRISLHGHYVGVNKIEFTRDSKNLISIGQDQQVLLWNIDRIGESGDTGVMSILGYMDNTSIALDVDSASNRVVVGTMGLQKPNYLYFFPISSKELVRAACIVSGRNLTDSEWSLYFPDKQYTRFCSNGE